MEMLVINMFGFCIFVLFVCFKDIIIERILLAMFKKKPLNRRIFHLKWNFKTLNTKSICFQILVWKN